MSHHKRKHGKSVGDNRDKKVHSSSRAEFDDSDESYESQNKRSRKDKYDHSKTDKYNQSRTDSDKYNQLNTDRYNQSRTDNYSRTSTDRYNQSRNGTDEYYQSRTETDRYNQSRNDADEYNQSRNDTDEYKQSKTDKYNQSRTDKYSQSRTDKYKQSRTEEYNLSRADKYSQSRADKCSQSRTDKYSQSKTDKYNQSTTDKNQSVTNKYNQSRTDKYENCDTENYDNIESHKKKRKSNKKEKYYERDKRPQNLDDSSRTDDENIENETVSRNKSGNKKIHSSNRDFDEKESKEKQHKKSKTNKDNDSRLDKYRQLKTDKYEKRYDIVKNYDIESHAKKRKSKKREESYERDDTSIKKYEMKDMENNSKKSRMDFNQEKRSNFSGRNMRPREYIDLDDPNRIDDINIENEVISSNRSSNTEKISKKDDIEPLSKKEKICNINTRTGGAYIPPARLRMMQESIQDKSSEAYQRLAWEALKKTIIGMTNKVNSSNISEIVVELFKENIIRGRGVLTRAIMQAQGASPTFTRVYAALVAIINTKFPEIGELILKRLILQYKRGFRRNDKTICLTAARFLAHLLNQEVAHEVLVLEVVTHLLEKPTDDSVEVAICILKECGKKLTQLTARGMRAITQRVRDVLHEGSVNPRTRYMIEVFFAIQKDGFKDFEIISEDLDLVEEEDKFTHLITLDEAVDAQEMLNVFKFDPEYLENEEKYKAVVKEILGDSDEEESGAESDSEGEEEEEEEKKEESQQIVDMTETNIVCLRRKIYLTIQSSLDFEECAHKLLKLELKPGQILEMCYMILDCCAQQRTYEKFYGLLAQRFCQLNKIYVEPFTEIFQNSYKTIHRLETNKLRNVAKFFAHLLFTDAISWTVLSIIKLNEDDTSSSSRIFIKILFQELCEYLGLAKLNERVKDVTLQEAFEGLFPRDLPHNTRFAINFFTSIGLGGLTDELREHLKNMQKTPMIPTVQEKVSSSSSAESSSSTSSSSSSSSSDSDSE